MPGAVVANMTPDRIAHTAPRYVPFSGVLGEFLGQRVRFLRPEGGPTESPNFGSVLVTFLARGAR